MEKIHITCMNVEILYMERVQNGDYFGQ